MSITLTLTADDGSDMRRHLLNLLGLYAVDDMHTSPYMPNEVEQDRFDPKHPDKGDFGKLVGGDPRNRDIPGTLASGERQRDATLGEMLYDERQPDANQVPGRPWVDGDTLAAPGETAPATEPQGSPPEAAKKKRAHRRVKPVEAPVAAPVAPQEAERDPIEEALDALTTEVDEESEQQEPDLVNAVSNEMLKREVISSLSDMFTAGNVKVVRHVLHKYGHGAKSFPEIDPAHFPEIKAALDRNEAA
jgi:hypothetical protein